MGSDANHAPEIRGITLVPDRVAVGGSVQVRVDAVDSDGDRLFYRFAADSGTFSVPDPGRPEQAVYVHNGSARTSDRITVVVTDARNAGATASRILALEGNQAPTVTLEWVGGGSRAECHPVCTLTFEAKADDSDGDALTYAWTGCAAGTGTERHRARCQVLFPGTFELSIVVMDGHGGVTTASGEAVGTNEPPFVGGGHTVEGPRAFLQPFYRDPEGDALDCGWSGNCTCTGENASLNLFCDVPSGIPSCAMRFACVDPFGAKGETRFPVLP